MSNTQPPQALPIIDTHAIEMPPLDPVSNLLEKLRGAGAAAGRIKLYRIVNGSRRTIPGATFDADSFDDQKVAETYGAGKYFAQHVKADGTLGTGATFEVDDERKTPIVAIQPPQQPGNVLDAIMRKLDELDRRTAAPIIAHAAHVDPLKQMEQLASVLKGLQQPAPSMMEQIALIERLQGKRSTAAELMELHKLSKQLAGNPPEGDDTNAPEEPPSLIEQLAATLLPKLAELLDKPKPAAPQRIEPNPPPALPPAPQSSETATASQGATTPPPTTNEPPQPAHPLLAALTEEQQRRAELAIDTLEQLAEDGTDPDTAAMTLLCILKPDNARALLASGAAALWPVLAAIEPSIIEHEEHGRKILRALDALTRKSEKAKPAKK